ncbi:pectate lyase [Pedobacter gandavensis]|uniref:Pectate lyase n=1 Tax=Pedobacter gandavensis TaxID=2679963 RepID=A0ABR6ERV1_9SPHI|nr:pectate lyase [Pedobacter gandavensis]MBB2147706.1 pectate lyase [Pedobacter gandavensis]
MKILTFALMVVLQSSCALAQNTNKASSDLDSTAEKILVYQRSVGGWPKAVGKVAIDYDQELSAQQRLEIKADSLHDDATIDNKATTRELRYLAGAYRNTRNSKYLAAVKKGIDYLFKAQYENGGWPQYFPDHHLYRGQVTYNDNAMVNVLNVLQDLAEGKEGFEVLSEEYRKRALGAIEKGISCILKTQVLQDGKLTVWCAQYDQHSLEPAQARKFEPISLSGMESVYIVEFLMRQKNPSTAIIAAVKSAVAWFDKAKITGYDFVFIKDSKLPGGKDRVLKTDSSSVIWARFYDIPTNIPIFTGRESVPKKAVAEIELERRVGYAWYGKWPENLIDKKYPKWLKQL